MSLFFFFTFRIRPLVNKEMMSLAVKGVCHTSLKKKKNPSVMMSYHC